jgi:O-antigen ligase
MMALTKSFRLIALQGTSILLKGRKVWISLVTVGLGILFGYLFSISQETAELVGSIIGVLIVLLLIAKNPLTGLLVLLFFTPFIEEWVEIPMGEGLPDLSFSRFTFAFLAVFLLAKAAIGELRFNPPVIGLAELCILTMAIGIASSAPLSISPVKTLQETFTRYFLPLSLYFFARHLVKNKEDLHKVLVTIALFGFAACVYAIYELTTGHVLFVGKETDVASLDTSYTENLWMIRGLLGRSGNFGRVVATTIPVTFYLFFENKQIRWKMLLAGMLIVQFYGLFISYNRTSWYSLLISLSVLQFFYPQFRKFYLVLILVAGVTLWATWDQVTDSTVVEERVNERTEDFNGRSARWEAGMEMWRERPIRGWGYDQYEEISGRFRQDGSRKNFGSIESDYLDILSSTGLLGFAPYIGFLVIVFISSFLLYFKARAPDWPGFVKPEMIAIVWCTLGSFLITSYTQIQNEVIVKMLPFALAGSIIGTHQYLLNRSRYQRLPK